MSAPATNQTSPPSWLPALRRYFACTAGDARWPAMGFALADVRELLLLEDGLDCCTAQKLARAKLEQVERPLADLRRMRARLADTVAAYADGVRARCPLIDALLE